MKTRSLAAAALTFAAAAALLWVYGFTMHDLLVGAVLSVWVLIVVFYLSRLVARRTNKYIARKFIHFTTGGLVTLLIYFTALAGDPLFSSPAVPVAAGLALSLLTLVPHLEDSELTWFQVKNNFGEVWFCFTWSLLFLLFWYVDLIVPVVATFFMAYGDGVTGVVRNYVYRRWTKGFWGSVAMFLVSAPFGALAAGLGGFISATVATIVEKMPWIDDNLTVPLVSAALLFLMRQIPL